MAGPQGTGIELFFSYAHEDEALRDELAKHLILLERKGVIQAWHDREIAAGAEWRAEIEAHLNSARIILLLVSADFLSSDFCWDIEMQRALARHKAGQARVIPIILRPVDWQDAPFGHLQALPRDGKPITTWANQDEAFVEVARGIRRAVEELAGRGEPVGTRGAQPAGGQAAAPRASKGPARGAFDAVLSAFGIESGEVQAAHNRQAMLQRVRSTWVKGVFERSLHGMALLELGLEERANAVERPWAMLLQPDEGPVQPATGKSVREIFDEMDRALLILGEPGSGKTTLLLELARDMIAQAEANPIAPIPVVFNLASWSRNRKPIEQWLIDEFNTRYDVPRRVAAEWLNGDALLLLLDGLDEVEPGRRGRCVEAINAFRAAHGLTDIVVCCRRADYEALPVRLKLRGAVLIQPLADEQIDACLAQGGDRLAGLRTALECDAGLRELARAPLLLSIMTIAYSGAPAPALDQGGSVHDRRAVVFERYIQRMLGRGERKAKWTQAQVRKYLGWLAGQLARQDQSEFRLEELQPGSLSSRRAGWGYLYLSRLLVCLCLALPLLLVAGLDIRSFGWLAVGPFCAPLGAIACDPSSRTPAGGRDKENVAGSRWQPIKACLLIGLGAALASLAGQLAAILVRNVLGAGEDIGSNLELATFCSSILWGLPLALLLGLRNRDRSARRDIVLAEGLRWNWKRFAATALAGGALLGGLLYVPAAIQHPRVQLWDWSGRQVAAVPIHRNLFITSYFTPDGGHLVVERFDGWMEVRSAETGAIEIQLRAIRYGTEALDAYYHSLERTFDFFGRILLGDIEVTPNGTRLLIQIANIRTRRQSWELWDLAGGKLIKAGSPVSLSGPLEDAVPVILDAAGERFIAPSAVGTVSIYSTLDGAELFRLENGPERLTKAGFSPDAGRVLIVAANGKAGLWNARDGRMLAALSVDGYEIRRATFNQDGTRMTTDAQAPPQTPGASQYPGVTSLWNGLTGRLIARLGEAQVGPTPFSLFTPDGSRVITSRAGALDAWDSADGTLLWHAENAGSDAPPSAVQMSPNGKRLVTEVSAGRYRLWDLDSGQSLATQEAPRARYGWPLMRFSPDGAWVATTDGNTVQIWDAQTGNMRQNLKGLASPPRYVFFNSTGAEVAAAGEEAALVWSTADGTSRVQLVGRVEGATADPGRFAIRPPGLTDLDWLPLLGVAIGLVAGLLAGMRRKLVREAIRPGQGIKQSIRNGLVIGLLVSIVAGLASYLALWLQTTPKLALSVAPDTIALNILISAALYILISACLLFMPVALWFGWLGAVQHLALRSILIAGRRIPWRYVRFLNDCSDCALLQTVGGGYIFVHRLLLEHFAGLEG